MIRSVALLLTFLTGFSGLAYEVAWQRYLGTLLGSHSEATAAVLAIFLGGLSVGYWLFGHVTRTVVNRARATGSTPRLLLIYGIVEASIGLYVFAFPWLFRVLQVLSYSVPHGPLGIGFAIDVLLAALLIGPASVLMGGTIPILTQALSRSLDDATRLHAFVYAFNTAGAFLGCLVAGFYLVPALGLERLMVTMGVLNLSVGSVFIAIGFLRPQSVVSEPDTEDGPPLSSVDFRSYVFVALLTGFAMMALQTTLIRIGALSFGSSQFTFSMVVAVFVASIALGSFAVSSMSHVPGWLVWANQWALAFFLLLLYFYIEQAPYWVFLIRMLFQETDAGFYGYYFFGFLLMLVIIGPPVVLSGASLPLLFAHMRREAGHLGDLAGTLYSWNTVGSLLGALLGGYVLFFWLDMHEIYRISMATLVVAAAVLTARIQQRQWIAAIAAAPMLLALLFLPTWEPEVLYAGMFRYRDPGAELYQGPIALVNSQPHKGRIIHHTDGPTASVVVRRSVEMFQGRHALVLQTDGMGDGDTIGDYDTAAFAAVMPAMMADKAERAFVIGWGMGITAGELASFDEMKEVVVAEISHEVTNAGPYFDSATQNASQNPKIRLIEADAYRALMRQSQQYDVIVSAPSHLWVSGVEMLFSREFLEAARSRLSPGGVHCQFVHRYEIDDETIALVLRNYAAVYEHVSVWQDANRSMFFLGFNDSSWAADQFRLEARTRRPDFEATLARMGIESYPMLLARELLPLGVVNALPLEGPYHSLFHPRLNNVAARAFFRNDTGSAPFGGLGEPAQIGRRNSLLRAYIARRAGGPDDEEIQQILSSACRTVREPCVALIARWLRDRPDSEPVRQILAANEHSSEGLSRDRLMEVSELLEGPASSPERSPTDVARARRASDDFVEYYNHAEPFDPTKLVDIWSRCRLPGLSEAECRARVVARSNESLDTPLEMGQSVDASLEEHVKACMKPTVVSEACRQGLADAQALVDPFETISR